MKKRFVLFLALVMLAFPTACSRSDPADGRAEVKNTGGGTSVYQLAEIGKTEEGETCVFFQGSESKDGKETFVCTNEFSGAGFKWNVHIGASIACGGKTYEPVETIPYLSGRPGNVVCFVFDTDEAPETVTVYNVKNKNGAATLTVSELKLDPELTVSGKIAKLTD